jgi:peroxiredoxin
MTETSGMFASGCCTGMKGLFIIAFVKPTALLIALLFILLVTGCTSGTRPPRIGTVAPDFSVQDQDRKITLSQFRGKIVVLNFWASWCAPCVAETPSLIAMTHALKDRDVVVLAVSIDDDDSAYRRFVKDHPSEMVTIRDAQQASNTLYGTFRFPETYIVDRNGVLRRKFIGQANWTEREIMDYLTKL